MSVDYVGFILAIAMGIVLGSVLCTGLYMVVMVKFGKKITQWMMKYMENLMN